MNEGGKEERSSKENRRSQKPIQTKAEGFVYLQCTIKWERRNGLHKVFAYANDIGIW